VLVLATDVTKWDQVQAMVKQMRRRNLVKIDILVNNHGVVHCSPVDEMPEEEWDLTMDVNVKGTFLCCKAVVPLMKKQGGGKIINLASIAGKGGFANMAHYCASKFAVVGFTNSLAKELARQKYHC
jgi:meso-butanediol dehydrogenase/(S,S)-butanediol dehydrogenase/diacetyl reductase